jgi:hypothetical protein
MYKYRRVVQDNIYFIRINRGESIQEALNKACKDLNIKAGRITAIGAINPAVFGFYDFDERYYKEIEKEGNFELVSLVGNISLKDDEPFAHAHIIVGDSDGNVYGGHLLPGTKAIVCEAVVEVFEGDPPKRHFEDDTGLYLWKL